MFDANAAGVYVIAVTPFTDSGAIDQYSIDSMVDFYSAHGATGLTRLAQGGERKRAQDMFDAHLPYLRYEQQVGVGLAARKYVLKKRGAIRSDATRKPMMRLSPEATEEVEWLLARLIEQTGLKL